MVVRGFNHRTTGGKKSLRVVKREDGTVLKAYNVKRRRGLSRFRKEVAIMKHLRKKGCEFVPKLLEVREKEGVFIMTYVGRPIPRNLHPRKEQRVLDKMKRKLRVLHEKYGVVRKRHGRVYYKVQMQNNWAMHKGKLYHFDFGSDWTVA